MALALAVLVPRPTLAMVEVGSLGGDQAVGVTVVRNLAYVANGKRGVTIVDVGDSAAPVQVGAFETWGPAPPIPHASTRLTPLCRVACTRSGTRGASGVRTRW
jgi:hypothetical protein